MKLSTKRILLLSAAIIAMLAIALNIGILFELVNNVLAVLRPVMIGCVVAFILNILASFYKRRVFCRLSSAKKDRKKLIWVLSILATFFTALVIIALVLLVIIPQIINTINSIIDGFPAFADRTIKFSSGLLARFDVSPKSITDFVLGGEAFLEKLMNFANNNLKDFAKSVVEIGSVVISGLSDILFGVFIAAYLLFDKNRVLRQCRRLSRAVLKPSAYERVSHIARVSNKSFSSFIGGQFIEAVILALLCLVGMLIFGFPYAPAVAVLIGITALVPIVGAWIGAGVSFFLILIVSPVKALWFLVFYIVLQQIETNFIYPKVVGMQVGLPGIWVLISVVIGTGLFGAVGALVAVPATSVIYTLVSEYVSDKEKSKKAEKDELPVE